LDATGEVTGTSIAVDADGDPIISHQDSTNWDVKFATCDMSATGCDAPGEWTKVTVDADATGGGSSRWIAANAGGDAMISYQDGSNGDLKFATCDLPATGCDTTADWTTVTVDATAQVGGASIAVDPSGDLLISYQDGSNGDLKFATCDLSATGCDGPGEWTREWVETDGDAGNYNSIAVDADAHPVISYRRSQGGLRFALGSAVVPEAVDGIAQLPDVASGSGSSGPPYTLLAGGLAAAVLALAAGAWYDRRRRLR
jgi:hypothetical protein